MSPERAPAPAAPTARAPLRPGVLLLVGLAAVLLAYSRAPQGGFAWDDHPLIEEQQLVKELQPPSTYFGRMFWSNPLDFQSATFYRPLTTLSFAVDYAVGGGKAFVFHVTNLAIHLIVFLFVYLLARSAGAGPLPGALAATAFGVFPRLTESVCWISGRTDLLAAAGALGGLALAFRARRWSALLAGLAIMVGLFAKEVAGAALVGIFCLELLRTRGPHAVRTALSRAAPAAVGPAVYAALRLHAHLVSSPPAPAAFFELPWRLRPWAALQALGTYALMLVDPLRPRLRIGLLGRFEVLPIAAGAAVLAAGVWLALRAARTPAHPEALALFATGAAALVPVLHFIPLAENVVAADRFLYLPCACLAAGLPAVLQPRFTVRARGAAVVAAVAIAAFAMATYRRSLDWVDEFRLWRVAAETGSPLDSKPWGNLGNLYLARNRFQDALQAFQRAEAIDSQAASGLYGGARDGLSQYSGNIALCEERLSDHAGAIALLQRLVERFPAKLLYRYNLAMAYARALRFDEAEATLRAAPGPADEARTKLLELFASSQKRLEALPPERRDEALETRVERATLDDELGRSFEASQRWLELVEDPAATPDLVLRGAGYLAIYGAKQQATSALQRARQAGAPAAAVQDLEQLLADRWST